MGKGILGLMVRVLYRLYNTLFDYSPYFLPFLVFAFKFAEWYSQTAAVTQTKPIPSPPPPPSIGQRGDFTLPLDKTICPICGDARTNPAALSCSGFVFCYPCIHSYVEEHSRCPITSLPSRLLDIRRIYESA